MVKLFSHTRKGRISNKVVHILRNYHTGIWQNFSRIQHQNLRKDWSQTVKRYRNTIIEVTNAPQNTCFLCL